MPICIICLSVALCCTCSRYRKAKRSRQSTNDNGEETKAEGVDSQSHPPPETRHSLAAATNTHDHDQLVNLSTSMQGSHIYDYIPDITAVQDSNGVSRQAEIPVDGNRAYGHTDQGPEIPVNENRAYECAQDLGVPVDDNRAYEHRQEILMGDNKAYEHCPEPPMTAMKSNTSYNYRQPLLARNIAYEDSQSVIVESEY